MFNVLVITNMIFICLQRPLTLAKIVGTYSIGFKNSKTGNSKRLDVVVMENLLYGHAPTNTKVRAITISNQALSTMANSHLMLIFHNFYEFTDGKGLVN